MRDVHWCVTVDYEQIANGNIANQIHGFTIDYGKFILIVFLERFLHCYKSGGGEITRKTCNSSDLKGHCHAIWQLFKKLGVFASIEFQN